jgi:hypothetical protein
MSRHAGVNPGEIWIRLTIALELEVEKFADLVHVDQGVKTDDHHERQRFPGWFEVLFQLGRVFE